MSQTASGFRGNMRYAVRYRGIRTAAVTQRVKKYVAKRIARYGEMKHINTLSAAGAAVVAVPAVNPGSTPLTSIIQGAGINQRDGLEAKLYKLVLKMSFTAPAAAGQPNLGIRVIIFKDKNPNQAATATYNQVVTTGGTAGNEFIANQGVSTFDRFKILYDKFLRWDNLSQGQVTSQSEINRTVVIRFKKGMLLRYTDATAVSWLRDHIFLQFVTDAAVTAPSYKLECNLSFKDPQ